MRDNQVAMKRRLKIYQIAEGYCYNSDSLFLWDFILPHIKSRAKVLELGSGSGIIGLLCAKSKAITLYQIEKQREYALMNAKNAQINHIDSIVIHADCNMLIQSKELLKELQENMLCNKKKSESMLVETQFKEVLSPESLSLETPLLCSKIKDSKACHVERNKTSNMESKRDFSTITQNKNNLNPTQSQVSHHNEDTKHLAPQYANITSLPYFDLIISNPPFYHTQTLQSNNPFKAQATQSHFLPFSTMLKLAKRVLKPHGKFIFCYAPAMLPEVLESLRAFGFGVESLRFVYPRIEKDSSLVLICAKFNSKAQTRILPPLITHKGLAQQDNTDEVLSIYKAAHTQSIKVAYDDIVWENLLRYI